MKLKILLFLLFSTHLFSVDFIYSGQLKPGMKGYALTVFSGNEKVKVPIEILGIMKNQTPGENRVIIKCSGPVVEHAGIIQGMSGSPVFINNKLAGAVSFGWAFGKDPIGGMTPIESMLDIMEFYNSENKDSDIRFKKIPNFDTFLNQSSRSFLTPELETFFNNSNFFSSGFYSLPFNTNQTGSSESDFVRKLEPGDSLGVALVRGDLNLYSIGTVTYTDNNKVLAFGHPMFSLGTIRFPMHHSDIITVYPSSQVSNKIGTLGSETGMVVQDRNSGIMGIQGEKAPVIPMHVQLNSPAHEKVYKLEMVDHPLLTPFLTNISFNNIFTAATKNIGFSSFNMKGLIEFYNHEPIILESLISDVNFIPVSGNIASLVQIILQNPFEPVRIKGINITLNMSEELRQAQIQKVKLSKYELKAGETVRLEVHIKPFQGELFIKNIQLKIPETLKPGSHTIELGDGISIMKKESQVMARRIESLDGFIRLVNTYLKNNKIYFSISTETDALYMGETVQSSIPGSVIETVKPQGTHIPVSSRWKEYHSVNMLSLEYVINGYFSIPITVIESNF